MVAWNRPHHLIGRVHEPVHRFPRRNVHLRPQVPHTRDDVLQHPNPTLRIKVAPALLGLRIARQRQRLRPAFCIHRQTLPQLFSNKRRHWMQQPQRLLERRQHVLPLVGQARVLGKRQLLEFDVPIAELAPEELVKCIRRVVIAEFFIRLIDLLRHLVEPRKDPTILQRDLTRRLGRQRLELVEILRRPRLRARLLQAHKHEPDGIPNLVCKGAVACDALLLEHDIGALAGRGD